MTAFQPGDRVHLKGHALVSSATGTVTGTDRNGDPLVRWDDNHTTTPHHPQHLEPAGEPMSAEQHFGNAYGTLKVRENGESGSIYITIDSQGSCAGVGIEEAPALALAILEAAGIADKGFNESSDAEMAVAHLASHVGLERANAKEAADREALEAETLALLNAHRMEAGRPAATSLDDYSIEGDRWRAVARTARTLYGVTK